MTRKYPEVQSPLELSLAELPLDGSSAVLWGRLFGAERPLRVEIGVGNSSFLIEVARSAPQFNYLGFEYSRKRVLKFLKKVEAAAFTNIRMLRVDAGLVIGHLFQDDSVDHVYINHPDPWPKRRHARKRFVSTENAREIRRLLAPGGGLSLRTDVPQYALQMLEVLDGTEGLENLAGKGCFAPAPLENHPTPYERKFLGEGRKIFYMEYIKIQGRSC